MANGQLVPQSCRTPTSQPAHYSQSLPRLPRLEMSLLERCHGLVPASMRCATLVTCRVHSVRTFRATTHPTHGIRRSTAQSPNLEGAPVLALAFDADANEILHRATSSPRDHCLSFRGSKTCVGEEEGRPGNGEQEGGGGTWGFSLSSSQGAGATAIASVSDMVFSWLPARANSINLPRHSLIGIRMGGQRQGVGLS